MALDMVRARDWLAKSALKELFVQGLGWDRFRGKAMDVEVDGIGFAVEPVAEKCGFAVFLCRSAGGAIPDYPTRRKLEARIRKLYHEHIIVFTDDMQTEQKWLWVRREPGKPTVGREYTYRQGQSGEALLQRLNELAVELEEELKGITIVDIAGRVAKGLDRDKVSKKFYTRFKDEHAKFLKFLKGIPDEHLQRWYASVMLNRLMFIYFIQKKGFLSGDVDYLGSKLAESKQRGRDRFYRDFLCPLFFEGFAKKEADREPKTRKLLGKVPYLNGGIFQLHQIETAHGRAIEVPDKAFEALFAFFDEYRWHLDERPLKDDKEINPDVLGYIFEKYINQKQMGAYYTKEDITEYIGRNTIVPRLLDIARKNCKVAFEGDGAVWRLLQADPDRYIFEPVRRGVIADRGHDPNSTSNSGSCPRNLEPSVIPESRLPDFVQKGMHDPKARMFEKRYNLGDAELLDDKGNKLTLPTETWREYVARRQRCLELRKKLAKGEVRDVNDLITYNLDIRQFAQDAVEDAGPELLRAVWRGLNGMSVLDPTCGSGAFLFAALNILEPLYVACINRMRVLLGDLAQSGRKHSPKKYEDFRKVLEQVEQHPNEHYFILKTIIVSNLYGVDIMEEAVEICKLRLFLKLAAQVDPDPAKDNFGIEPLPDIDFNIRCGNTLVGYATYEQVERAVSSKLDFEGAMEAIEEKAQEVERLTASFRLQQTEHGGEVTAEDKDILRTKLAVLESELNLHLAREYGKNPNKSSEFKAWLDSHKPFHWFIEFYGIMKSGGFDVIIGNPPWIEYTKVVSEYSVQEYAYKTLRCGNIYAPVLERCFTLQRPRSRSGMIVQMSAICTDRMVPLQGSYLENSDVVWASAYDDRPSKLFSGLQHVRAAILLCRRGETSGAVVQTTGLTRWKADGREVLFALVAYRNVTALVAPGTFPKASSSQLVSLMAHLRESGDTLASFCRLGARTAVYYHRSPLYWIRSMDFLPHFASGAADRSVHHFKDCGLREAGHQPMVGSVLNSTLFYLWFIAHGNGRNVALRDITTFPVPRILVSGLAPAPLPELYKRLMKDYRANSVRRRLSNGIEYDEFYPSLSKPIIDKIDQVLAKHYGFTDEELDFIINYDIKYRMGRGAGSAADE